jgi:hypothetical protein
MSEPESLGPPDPELEAFFAAERERAPAPEAARHAALARVLGAAPAPVPVGISRAAAAAMTTGALVVGLVAGALGHQVLTAPPPPVRPAPSTALPVAVATAPEVLAPPAEVVEAPAVVEAPVAEAPVVEVEPPPTSADDGADDEEDSLGDEMALVARAQTALHRGLFASALSALDEHARRFPRGDLAEEREALAVQALARAGRDDEASARASRFEARYPRSVLVPVVRAAVDGAP